MSEEYESPEVVKQIERLMMYRGSMPEEGKLQSILDEYINTARRWARVWKVKAKAKDYQRRHALCVVDGAEKIIKELRARNEELEDAAYNAAVEAKMVGDHNDSLRAELRGRTCAGCANSHEDLYGRTVCDENNEMRLCENRIFPKGHYCKAWKKK